MVSSPRNGRCINFYSVRGRGLFSRLRARRSTDFNAYNDTKLLSFLQFPNSLLLHPYIKTMQWPCPKAVIVSGEVCMEGRGEGGRAARSSTPKIWWEMGQKETTTDTEIEFGSLSARCTSCRAALSEKESCAYVSQSVVSKGFVPPR